MRYNLILVIGLLLTSCSHEVRRFPLRDTVWTDKEDFRTFKPEPDEYETATIWSAVDETLLRPLTNVFKFQAADRAENVNAMDEVPTSSWFINRMSTRPLSPEEVEKGPCEDVLNEEGPFQVLGGKPDGFNPGFLVEAPNGKRYFFKFDYHEEQPERASLADVVGSKIYHAAGYQVPCNQIVYFKQSSLQISPKATKKDPKGNKIPMTQKDVSDAFALAKLDPQGRVRASASLFLEGKPLGPWTYADTRSDDPNDVIPHENRRELRAGYVLASWINHFDTRDQNSLSMWQEDPKTGKGYIRHNLIDFGDSFGNLAENRELSKHLGYSHYLDLAHVGEDWLTFGLWIRPWDRAEFGKAGPVLGFYDVRNFEADEWKPGYPNPAFSRMREDDGAWMARIIAEFTPKHIDAAVRAGRIQDPVVKSELTRILLGRRRKILNRWFSVLSPLSRPTIEVVDGKHRLCMKDMAVYGDLLPLSQRKYSASAYSLQPGKRALGNLRIWPPPSPSQPVCAVLPNASSKIKKGYLLVDLVANTSQSSDFNPARVHIYFDAGKYRVVGLERPSSSDQPF